MSRGTSPAGQGGTKRAPMRFKDWRRASSRGSKDRIRTSSVFRWPRWRSCSERFQVLDELVDLRIGQAQIERLVVVLYDGDQRRVAAVVIEAALLVRPQAFQG